jgi:hypothetical protein
MPTATMIETQPAVLIFGAETPGFREDFDEKPFERFVVQAGLNSKKLLQSAKRQS